MSETAVVVNTAVAILAVVVMIVRFRLNPVVSLVVGSAYLGLAVGLGVEEHYLPSPGASARSWPTSACSSPSAC